MKPCKPNVICSYAPGGGDLPGIIRRSFQVFLVKELQGPPPAPGRLPG